MKELSLKKIASVFRSFLNTSGRSVELDFVRGIAILLVIGFHAETLPTSTRLFRGIEIAFKSIGWTGVDLFFVLSGFLVGGVLLAEYRKSGKVDVKRFIIRRGFKIWPPYYFYILFQVIVHRHPIRSYLVANLLHIQNYIGSSLLHTWSLSLEEHFYLLLSIAMAWMVSRKWSGEQIIKAFAISACVVGVIRCLTWYLGYHSMAMQATHTRIDSLLSGVILAALYQFFPQKFERLANRKILLIAAAIFTIGFIAVAHNHGPALIGTIGLSVIYLGYSAFMLLVYRHSSAIKNLLGYRIIAKIGVYSYGIYLWHVSVRDFCVHFAAHFGPTLQWPIAMVCQYGTAIVLGAILTHVIEWPSLRLRDRMFPAKDRISKVEVRRWNSEGAVRGLVTSEMAGK